MQRLPRVLTVGEIVALDCVGTHSQGQQMYVASALATNGLGDVHAEGSVGKVSVGEYGPPSGEPSVGICTSSMTRYWFSPHAMTHGRNCESHVPVPLSLSQTEVEPPSGSPQTRSVRLTHQPAALLSGRSRVAGQVQAGSGPEDRASASRPPPVEPLLGSWDDAGGELVSSGHSGHQA